MESARLRCMLRSRLQCAVRRYSPIVIDSVTLKQAKAGRKQGSTPRTMLFLHDIPNAMLLLLLF